MRLRTGITLALVVLAWQVLSAAVARTGAPTAVYDTDNNTTATINIAVGSGDGFRVSATARKNSAQTISGTPTWNGSTTGVALAHTELDTGAGVSLNSWCVAAPSGTHDFVVTYSAAVPVVILHAEVFSGTHQTTPCNTAATSTGTGSPTTTGTVNSGATGMCSDALALRDDTEVTTPGGSQTESSSSPGTPQGSVGARMSYKAGSATCQMSYSYIPGVTSFLHAAVPIMAAAAGGASPRGTLIGILP